MTKSRTMRRDDGDHVFWNRTHQLRKKKAQLSKKLYSESSDIRQGIEDYFSSSDQVENTSQDHQHQRALE